MACSSCGTKTADGEPKGCRNNGTCGTSGCNRVNQFDWLSHLEIPDPMLFPFVEVKFKGGRKGYYRNEQSLDLQIGDYVVVEATRGYHIGMVSLRGELVRLQMKKLKLDPKDPALTEIWRLAQPRDMEKFAESRRRELPTLYRSRQVVTELNLNMKISDVEFQADGTKATFYYSADHRVDFRELIKCLSMEFRVRIEMRQISVRQEAARIGGIGSCGRELCCSTWLADLKNIEPVVARYQNLSINTQKVTGQCGRLKCCLNYELDTYLDALHDIPQVPNEELNTGMGLARLQKTDIFKKILWFSYQFEGDGDWYPLTAAQVTQALQWQKEGRLIPSLHAEEWAKSESSVVKKNEAPLGQKRRKKEAREPFSEIDSEEE
jgi:cell fate regulator YaaT (PSP1 superfamily)